MAEITQASAASSEDEEEHSLLEYPLLKALYRWRRTVALMADLVQHADSFFQLLRPFEEKETQFRRLMSDRVRAIPKPQRPGDKEEKVVLKLHRGPGMVCDVFSQLEAKRREIEAREPGKQQVLCLRLEDEEARPPPLVPVGTLWCGAKGY